MYCLYLTQLLILSFGPYISDGMFPIFSPNHSSFLFHFFSSLVLSSCSLGYSADSFVMPSLILFVDEE